MRLVTRVYPLRRVTDKEIPVEGQVGRAVLRDGQWAYEAFASAADIERVDNVFDALTKQIRQGWFELPVEGM